MWQSKNQAKYSRLISTFNDDEQNGKMTLETGFKFQCNRIITIVPALKDLSSNAFNSKWSISLSSPAIVSKSISEACFLFNSCSLSLIGKTLTEKENFQWNNTIYFDPPVHFLIFIVWKKRKLYILNRIDMCSSSTTVKI